MDSKDDPSRKVTRRKLLKGAATVAAGGAAVAAWRTAWKNSTYLFLTRDAPTQAAHPDAAWSGSAVRTYRPLGNTGIHMSDISFGGADGRTPKSHRDLRNIERYLPSECERLLNFRVVELPFRP